MSDAPLQSPKNQQAHHTMRGYGFQCWLTVEAWLDLKADEVLFVECAEDYAVFSKTKREAQIYQAKSTAAKFTLRSPDILDSINHYWDFHIQDTSLKICYCFVTTSDVTIEKGSPFAEEAGITFWMNVANSGDEAQLSTLIDFLREDETVKAKLRPSLLDFIKNSSPSEVLSSLIRPIVWDTCQSEIEGVKDAVVVRLSTLLEKVFGETHAHASNCATALFSVVYESGSEVKKTPLSRGILHNTLDNHLRPSQLAAMAARRNNLVGSILANSSSASPAWDFSKALPPIQIHEKFSKREQAVKLLLEDIEDAPFLLIEGSSGMGKSTLAQIVSFQIGGDWLHFRTRESELSLILHGLTETVSLIADSTNPICLIIDDFPWEKLDAIAFTTMKGLSHVARKKRARLIFTNHKAPSKRILESANMADLEVRQSPKMLDEEIIELSTRIGCADIGIAERWAPLIALQTSRHPQLIHSIIIELNEKGWPQASIEEFQWASSQVNQERDRSKNLLAQRSPEEIEYLTRLSVFFGSFKREYAISVADKPNRIIGASVVFDKLLGPWIERVGSDRFQVSDLIGKSLISDVSTRLRKEMNIIAAESIMETKAIDVGDAAGALWNSIAGESSSRANSLILHFLMAPNEHSKQISAHLSWLQFMATDSGQQVFAKSPTVDFLLRTLQLQVCTEIAPGQCSKFLHQCDLILESVQDATLARTLKITLAHTILSSTGGVINIDRLFWANETMQAEFPTLMEEMGRDGLEMPETPEVPGVAPGNHTDYVTASIVWLRASSIEGLQELLDFLATNEAEKRTKILTDIFQFKALAIHAFDQAWLKIEQEKEPDWAPTIILFNEFIDAAERWECSIMAVCAAKGLSIIYDEYLDDPQSANQALDRIQSEDPEVICVLSELRGKLALTAKDYKSAQSYFEIALPNNPFDLIGLESTLITLHNAGYSAGKADDWEASAAHFINAHSLAVDDENWTRAVAFATDAAYSYWRLDAHQSSINCLRDALSLCARMPNTTEDLAALKVQKLLGHILMQLAWRSKGHPPDKEDFAPISVGMCSNLEQSEALRDTPPPMLDFAWFFLLNLEFEHTQSSDLWGLHSPELLKQLNTGIRCQILDLQARKQIRDSSFPELISTAANLSVAYAIGAESEQDKPFNEWNNPSLDDPTIRVEWDENSLAPFILMVGITCAVITGVNAEVIFNSWRAYAESDSRIVGLPEWIRQIEEAYAADEATRISAAFGSPPFGVRWLSCLRLSQDNQLAAGPLYAISIFFLLKDWQSTRIEVRLDLYRTLDPYLSKLWSKACNNRYQFKSPTLFVPDIKELSGRPNGTVQHLAKLTLAASPSINIKLPEGLIGEIKELADS